MILYPVNKTVKDGEQFTLYLSTARQVGQVSENSVLSAWYDILFVSFYFFFTLENLSGRFYAK